MIPYKGLFNSDATLSNRESNEVSVILDNDSESDSGRVGLTKFNEFARYVAINLN
jgi:hypothetical protein